MVRRCSSPDPLRHTDDERNSMADVTVKRLDEFEAVFGGGMRRVRAGLGVTSFGMQVYELPPNFQHYPEHNHTHDEQEEVYTVLSGRATLRVGGEEYELEPGIFARVGPAEKRKFVTGEEGVRLLALGAVPGGVYQAPEFSEEGAPPPAVKNAEKTGV
jgi:mannose-6-phosphate isomerase-like protein (cupin superfamily)